MESSTGEVNGNQPTVKPSLKSQQRKVIPEERQAANDAAKFKEKQPKTSAKSSHRPHQRHSLQQRQQQQPSPQPLSPKSKEELRLRVNARERQRMHDMNGALDALRMAMPYARGPSVKKLSKMNTLLLARNYILLLTKTAEDLRRMLAEAVSYGGSLAGWPAKVDAAVLLGSVQDAYDKQRRYAEELLMRQEQQQQQHQQPLQRHHQQQQQQQQQPRIEDYDKATFQSWKTMCSNHQPARPPVAPVVSTRVASVVDCTGDRRRKASKRQQRDCTGEGDVKMRGESNDGFSENPKKAKAEKSLEISVLPREVVNSYKPKAFESEMEKSKLEAEVKIEKENRKLRLDDDGDNQNGDDRNGKKEEDEEEEEEEEDEVVVDSSFSAEEGDARSFSNDKNNDDDDDDDHHRQRHRRHHHHHHYHHQQQQQQQHHNRKPFLLSSLLSSSPPSQMSDEMVSSTTKRSAFQPVGFAEGPVDRPPVQNPERPQGRLDSPAPAARSPLSTVRKMAVQPHFPFFIQPPMPAYHHHHHHHLLPHLHPLLAHGPGHAHARHLVMTSLLENGRVIGTCSCQLCLPKDPL